MYFGVCSDYRRQWNSIETTAFPDSAGTNVDSWNPTSKPKGHYEICIYYIHNNCSYAYISSNSYFAIFVARGAEEPRSSGKPRII